MARLTEKRLNAAKLVLEKYRTELFERSSFDARSLEDDLRKIWKVGFQELKDVMLDLLKKQLRYREVAAFYMEQPSVPGVVSEFKQALADLYGISHYNDANRKAKRDEYWARVLAKHSD